MPAEPRVGLIGLGFVGAAIGERLLATGPAPVVHDVVPARQQQLVERGAVGAAGNGDLAARCDVVLLCVQTDEQCVEALAGDGGILDGAAPGTVVAVLATVAPRTVERLAELASPGSVHVLEAPMAGRGAAGIADASMFVLAAGDDDVVARARPALERFSRVLPTGPLGTGAALKLAHNVLVYVSRLAAYEAVTLARAAGIPDGLVEELTLQTGAMCEQSQVWLEIHERRLRGDRSDPIENEHMVTAAALMEKDLRHAVALGAELGLVLPGSAVAAGFGDEIYQVPPSR
jgi:3-hydroxyisobutyrate dehydrogenase-like beta-hydroxyacid dehydrogenase